MKKLARKLEEIEVECILPKHFKNLEDANSMIQLKQEISEGKLELNEEDFKRIAERENWFLKQIEEADLVIIYNEKITSGGEIISGYIGPDTRIDIGYALGCNKKLFLLMNQRTMV